MNKQQITTNKINQLQNEVILEVDKSVGLGGLKASGRMLVDSIGFSFIYLLDNNDDYTYISVQDSLWKELKDVLDNHLPVTLSNGTETIPLTDFYEELNYLVENIKGNSNYGQEMVDKVEAVFA